MKIYKCEILHDDDIWFTHHYTAVTWWLEEIEVEDWPESPAETTSEESPVAKGT